MSLLAQINNAAHTGAFGHNPRSEPTLAQLAAGNYKKGVVMVKGLSIAIENPAYTYRKGMDKTGQQWMCLMQAHYGYIQGHKGNDGDDMDVFIGVAPENDTVYIVNQKTADGYFDEHKIMLGFLSQQQAVDTYQHCFERGMTGLMSVVPCTMTQFKWWLANGDKSRPVTLDRLPYAGLERLDSVNWGGTDGSNLYSHDGQLHKLLYQIRQCDDTHQALEPLAYHDMIAELGNQGFMYENYDALIVEYNKLEKKAKQLLMVMQGAADTVKPVGVTVSKPLTKGGVANVVAWFEMDDGQAVGVFFHNPDKTPKKINPTDEMISYKWVLNKKDITIAVAPEQGKDLVIRTVAKRIMQLVEKNHDRFIKANGDKAALNQAEQDLTAQVAEKQAVLKGLQDEVAALQVRKAEKEANKAPTAEELTKQGFDGIATELKKLGWTDDLVMGGLTKSFVGAKESGSVNEDGVLNVNVSRENGLIRAQVGADTLIPNSVDNIPQYGLNAQTEQSYKKVADKVNNAVDAYVEQRKVELAINGKSTLSANQSTDYGFTFIKDDFDKNKYRLLDAGGNEYQVIWKSGSTWTMMTGETFKTLADAKNAAIDHALNRKETERQEKASRAEVDGMRTVDENNEIERIASLYAAALGHPVSKRSREFASDILSKNAYGLEFIANGMNDKGKKVFSEVTGVSLPKQQGATWKAIRDWAGVSDEQENYRIAVRDVAYETKAFMRENNVSQEMADKNKALIASKIAEGFDNVEKIGNSYWFTNNAGQGINLSEKPKKGYLGLSKSRALVEAMLVENKAKKLLDASAIQSQESIQQEPVTLTGKELGDVPTPPQERPSNWRTNLANARAVAKSLGLETKGKKLVDLVGEIEKAQTTQKSAPVPEPVQAPVIPEPTPAVVQAEPTDEDQDREFLLSAIDEKINILDAANVNKLAELSKVYTQGDMNGLIKQAKQVAIDAVKRSVANATAKMN